MITRIDINKKFYFIKPFIPRNLQLFLRRKLIEHKLSLYKDIWPINEQTNQKPERWNGWPDGKKFSLILTHDVELQGGHDKCQALMEMEKQLGFRSSFNFVPERYNVSPALREELIENGFEVCVHGLIHDGKLYSSKKIFMERAIRINMYLKEWNSKGFRSPSMHHNLEWIHELNIDFDMSTFDTDPFEPQSDSAGTIFPFWVNKNNSTDGYVELPYTLPQDFSLFILMREKNNRIWKKKLDWVAEKGGMALINVHPDYMNFSKKLNGKEEFPSEFYQDFLEYIKEKYAGEYWHVLPSKMASFVKENRSTMQMNTLNLIFDYSKSNNNLIGQV
ncbi:MAG: hypothetical protein ACM3RX_03605 [Methanococcaceae archaeon]